jgi:rhodanese-related sulfurtransferase
MSTSTPITLSSMKYITAPTLATALLNPTESSKIAIVDVRDSDHIGGNICGSQWVPVNQLDVKLPELIRTLKDKEKVVFHCMLSQQRGPKAALAYARAKQRVEEKEGEGSGGGEQGKTNQEICVLEGGFGSWQARYGEDERLTADYQPDVWE